MIEDAHRDLIRTIFESAIPFNQVIGLEVGDITSDRCTAWLDMRPELVGNATKGMLHGGVISAALDAIGGMVAMASVISRPDQTDEERIEAVRRLGTIDLRVDYLRPALGNRFEAVATPMRVGKTVAVTRMELHDQEGLLLAVGTGTYIVG